MLSHQSANREPAKSLFQQIKTRAIEYVLISFTDLSGTMRAKLVPVSALETILRDGLRFAAAKTALGVAASDPDIVALPDPASFVQLPWRPKVGWLASDLFSGARPLSTCPRQILKSVLRKAAENGWVMKHGVECEFIVVTRDVASRAPKPAYNPAGLMRRYDVLSKMSDAMLALDWQSTKIEQENAHGQFEVNWRYDHALTTADRHAFAKFMMRSIGERYGFRVTFMPLFFSHIAPTGCHAHVSLWRGENNLFDDGNDPLGLSVQGYRFIAGVMNAAPEICAITSSTVNSYRRLNMPIGARRFPLYGPITYAGNNRTHLIRVPGRGRFELRMPDGAVNPYLLPAAVLAAGLDGIAQRRDPGKPLDLDMFERGHEAPAGTKTLPLNLLDALRALEGSALLRDSLGEDFVAAYHKLKLAEWNEYARHLTDWERTNTLDQ